jgi:hypothetical protein
MSSLQPQNAIAPQAPAMFHLQLQHRGQGIESAANSWYEAFAQFQQGTGLSLVKLWLAGLLGDLALEQRGEFYDGAGVVLYATI